MPYCPISALLPVKWSLTGLVKNERKFQPISSKSGRVAYESWSLTRFDLETFGNLEKWSLRRGDRLREVVATRGSTVVSFVLIVDLCLCCSLSM